MTRIEDKLFTLTAIGEDRFTATIPSRGIPRLFGGHVAAQSLLAATRTTDGQPVHSFHSYFILAGAPDVPVEYHVDRTRTGRSFLTRHVTASQEDKVIFEMLASFSRPESGPDWQADTPEFGPLPDPVDGPAHPRLGHLVPLFDIRRVDRAEPEGWRVHPFWVQCKEPIGPDPGINTAILTYLSDVATLSGARAPGKQAEVIAAASLDHTVWFHRPVRVDEWLLFSVDGVINVGARGLVRGSFHNRRGQLVASVAQEGLLRRAPTQRAT